MDVGRQLALQVALHQEVLAKVLEDVKQAVDLQVPEPGRGGDPDIIGGAGIEVALQAKVTSDDAEGDVGRRNNLVFEADIAPEVLALQAAELQAPHLGIEVEV